MAIKDKLYSMRGIGRTMRAYDRYTERDGNFGSAAVTFYGFLSLFPLLALAAAVVAAALSPSRVQEMQDKISENVPGIADRLNLGALADNAGTVGVIGGVLLLISGLGWVEALRPSIRKMWIADEPKPEGFKATVSAKLKDVGVLIGLGLAMALTVGASAFATSVIGRISDSIGLEDQPVGRVLLQIAAFAVAVFAGVVLFLYLLVGMPRLSMPRPTALIGALIGAIGFEVLKFLVAAYISGVASKSMYGAFGVPVALLLWIYFVTRLLIFCAAWQATDKRAEHLHDDEGRTSEQSAKADDDATVEWRATEAPDRTRTAPGAAERGADADPAKPPHTVRNYALGMLGTAGAGMALERFTRRPRGTT
ncbi:YihY/virulence factor BrkB family protein [Yinghuangia soli]|uniref:YihY/virulence factor BrkB family protein n=1 Tax=Yinghuangia soli TaxID=2908204 RepID=A0AA41Q1W9_9ACTN|nr:YihY/virulence factor BrkB family protein [Yinghuangia soli]MCF2530013.1 YihY/virulence factor BrkB family protein [Yinghuangia soli]